jgi:hypothetical protein
VKGYVKEDCSGATFHFPSNGSGEVVLRFDQQFFWVLSPVGGSSEWYSVSGKKCFGDAKCQDAVKASIQFWKIKGKHASGTYRIEFSDGYREEETFTAKSRRIKPTPICE